MAYQWLRFLSDEKTLSAHLETLRVAHAVAARLSSSGRGPGAPGLSRSRSVARIDLYHITALFRANRRGGGLGGSQ